MKPSPWLPGLVLLAFGACARHAPQPTPPNRLPVVARMVVVLRTPQDRDAHGDIVIPRSAITTLGGLPGVFILSHHGRARFRLVKVGTKGAATAEILSGLGGHETLILPPFRHLYDGSPVRVLTRPR